MQESDRCRAKSRRSRQYLRSAVAAALLLGFAARLFAQTAILQVRVVEGDGAVHPPGSRPPRSLVIEVTDETGTAVSGATASFRLPDEGPTGLFPNGLRTDLAVTDAQGRATIRGIQFNRTPGEFPIRITVKKQEARAGTVSTQYIAGSGGGPVRQNQLRTRAATPNRKWLVLAAVAASVAAGSVAALIHGSTARAAAPTVQPAQPSIGAPAITIGRP